VERHGQHDQRYMDRREVPGKPPRQVDVRHGAARVAEPLRDCCQRAVEAVAREDRRFGEDHGAGDACLPVGASPDPGVEDVDHRRLDAEPGEGVHGLDGFQSGAAKHRRRGVHGR